MHATAQWVWRWGEAEKHRELWIHGKMGTRSACSSCETCGNDVSSGLGHEIMRRSGWIGGYLLLMLMKWDGMEWNGQMNGRMDRIASGVIIHTRSCSSQSFLLPGLAW